MQCRLGLLTSRTTARLLGDFERRTIETPFGHADLNVGAIGKTEVVSIDRYGVDLTIPSHKINYRANLWALRSLGVERLVSQNAIGSLRETIAPGSIMIADDFLDRTTQRPRSLFDEWNAWVRVDMTSPFCPEIREALCRSVSDSNGDLVSTGVFACFEGPRFETRAEIRALQRDGADIVGTPLVPEVVMARELGMCFASIAPVINYATGLTDQVSNADMNDFYYSSGLHDAVEDAIVGTFEILRDSSRACQCASAMLTAYIGERPPWLDELNVLTVDNPS